jgi:hypothetical protein
MTGGGVARALWLLVALSLIPAALLTVRRVQSEGGRRSVAVVMDEVALRQQAHALGIDSLELALRYRELGLTGVALYEETIETLAAKGRIVATLGSEMIAEAVARGEAPPDVPADSTLVSALVPGALDALLAKNRPEPRRVAYAERNWYVYPGNGLALRPAGPDLDAIRAFAEAGFDLAYRPRNSVGLRAVGSDLPAEASYLIHAGLAVSGHPNALDDLVAASAPYLTALIEGTDQDGMRQISHRVPTVRLLSFNQDHINRTLSPDDLIEKFLLAVNERGVRLLYLRPYTEEQQGDMFVNSEALVEGLVAALERERFDVGPLGTLDLDYRSDPLLRALSAVGVLAGLALLALMYPGLWGALAALAVLGLGLVAGGLDWAALALVAALVFPVIGYGHLQERPRSLPLATAISLAGALLLVAVGSDREAMLGISPFAGVAATLVVPPALFLLHYALRFRGPADWIRTLWGHPVRVGNVLVLLLGGAALAIVFIRRGNFPIIGASGAELALRDWLAELFVRPRFKELLGHPLALLALGNRRWAAWVRGPLLTGGVVAQASILNSFSHYHTPVLISLERTLLALALGTIIGLALIPLGRLAVAVLRRWLTAPDPTGA